MTTASAMSDWSALLQTLRALLTTVQRGADGLSTEHLANRLKASVIRPLAALIDEGTDVSSEQQSVPTGTVEIVLWDLTRRLTAVCADPGCPPALREAAAALQELTCPLGIKPGDDRGAKLRTLIEQQRPSIQIAANGPLLLTNVYEINDWLGQPLAARPLTALCRCGTSAMKPYCDGSHADRFEDAKDPSRVANRLDTYVGQQVTIFDNRGICQHSGYCSDRLATTFRVNEEPFVAPSGGRMDEIVRAVRDCPSGALGFAIDGIDARADVDYHGKRVPTVEVSHDGPYRLTGAIAIIDADGDPIVRDAGASSEHYTLCRCGHAQNKPFCTGMHWSIEFHDPVLERDRTPTMFEWAGGLPALTRMTRLFYEKFVPTDELLAPVFARMAPDHPQRVAKWLGEVFCGPAFFSEEFGGYGHMISEHLGKRLTEDMRTRWVSLLLQSAREAGLPNDPEFRSAFQAYLEWGSRLAVENSQTDSRPPLQMPMPRWDWNTSAGPPGRRTSALAGTGASTDAEPVLPGADEALEFGKHIRALFRERDRESMKFAFDLWAYDDVVAHADAILERLLNGTMPCDGAWPKERVDVFARWVHSGKTE